MAVRWVCSGIDWAEWSERCVRPRRRAEVEILRMGVGELVVEDISVMDDRVCGW